MNLFRRRVCVDDNINVKMRCGLIKELIDIRDGFLISPLSADDAAVALAQVCCD